MATADEKAILGPQRANSTIRLEDLLGQRRSVERLYKLIVARFLKAFKDDNEAVPLNLGKGVLPISATADRQKSSSSSQPHSHHDVKNMKSVRRKPQGQSVPA